MTIGYRDLSTLTLATGVDVTVLRKFALADGTSVEVVAGQLAAALGALNGEFGTGIFSQLISFTDQLEENYRVGSSAGFELHTEYGRPDPQHAATDGHMLPLRKWDRALGWTWDYLESARMEQIQADIADAVKDARDLFRVQVLTRLFKRGDDSGAAYGLGTSGLSPGFATAAASTGVDFTPPAYGGVTFTTAHEHYVSIAGGAFTAAVFTDAKAELLEHGHMPPYMALVSPLDEATIRGLTGFIPVQQEGINYASTTTLASFGPEYDESGYYIGTLNDIRIRVTNGIPQYYAFVWKPYGALSQRNPLRIRVGRGQNRLAVTAANDPRNGSPAHPLQYMMLRTQFGVGVGDRTNGTPRYVNNANWADGTPT